MVIHLSILVEQRHPVARAFLRRWVRREWRLTRPATSAPMLYGNPVLFPSRPFPGNQLQRLKRFIIEQVANLTELPGDSSTLRELDTWIGDLCGKRPSQPASAIVLKSNDLAILVTLADANGELLTQEQIENAILRKNPKGRVSLRTIQARLPRLYDAGLAIRPEGQNSGSTITKAGLARIDPKG